MNTSPSAARSRHRGLLDDTLVVWGGEFDYHAVVDPVSVHDLHATMLHLLGIDHERFTYKFQGLDLRLTGVEPSRVVGELLA